MKIETMEKRSAKGRPMVPITLRMSEDVIAELKKIAQIKGFSGYQGLMRAYVDCGLREDTDQIEGCAVTRIIKSLREEGVPDEVLDRALAGIIL